MSSSCVVAFRSSCAPNANVNRFRITRRSTTFWSRTGTSLIRYSANSTVSRTFGNQDTLGSQSALGSLTYRKRESRDVSNEDRNEIIPMGNIARLFPDPRCNSRSMCNQERNKVHSTSSRFARPFRKVVKMMKRHVDESRVAEVLDQLKGLTIQEAERVLHRALRSIKCSVITEAGSTLVGQPCSSELASDGASQYESSLTRVTNKISSSSR